uniref:Uncharacterized protein n=1 Tax=Trichogramma kaykai TaxID=54128 RepID=A0ABD2X4Y9_9HYME
MCIYHEAQNSSSHSSSNGQVAGERHQPQQQQLERRSLFLDPLLACLAHTHRSTSFMRALKARASLSAELPSCVCRSSSSSVAVCAGGACERSERALLSIRVPNHLLSREARTQPLASRRRRSFASRLALLYGASSRRYYTQYIASLLATCLSHYVLLEGPLLYYELQRTYSRALIASSPYMHSIYRERQARRHMYVDYGAAAAAEAAHVGGMGLKAVKPFDRRLRGSIGTCKNRLLFISFFP